MQIERRNKDPEEKRSIEERWEPASKARAETNGGFPKQSAQSVLSDAGIQILNRIERIFDDGASLEAIS
jgi:hypothetical protein